MQHTHGRKGAGSRTKAGEKDHPANGENVCAVSQGCEAGRFLGRRITAFLNDGTQDAMRCLESSGMEESYSTRFPSQLG